MLSRPRIARRRASLAALALGVLALVLLVGATPAQAVSPFGPNVHAKQPKLDFAVGRNGHVHIMLTRARAAALRASMQSGLFLNPLYSHTWLPYNGGNVVRPTNTLYTIYWLPSGYHFEPAADATSDTSYQTIINQWAGDLQGTAWYHIMSQYPDQNGPAPDSTSFGGTYLDTTAYPCGATCSNRSVAGQHLTDTDIQNEVLRATKAMGWNPGQTAQFLVFYGNNVQSCASFGCSETAYCAYHGQFSGNNGNVSGQWIYSNMYDAATGCGFGQGSPNGDQSADDEINVLSHEVAETTTDLAPVTVGAQAWQNAAAGPSGYGGEIGDLCAWIWPGSDTTLANGHSYVMQPEWSNYDAACVQGDSIPTNTAYTGPTTASPGDTVNVTATLTDGNANGIGKQTVHLTLGSQSCDAVTPFSSSGVSNGQVSCPIVLSQPSGAYTVQAHFAGNGGYQSSDSAATPFSIGQLATTLAYTGPASGEYTDSGSLSAHLTETVSGNPIANESISFALDGGETCNATTDGSGDASCSVTPAGPVSTYSTVSASFAGDSAYLSSSDSKAYTVNPEDTATASTGSTSGDFNDQTTLSAHLSDPTDNTPIANMQVTLGFGAESCTPTTDASGNASCNVTPQDSPGSYPVTASYSDAAGNYQSASDSSQSFTVTPEDTAISYTGSTTSDFNDQTTLSAHLSDPTDNTPIANMQVTLGFGAESCTPTTNAAGDASCNVTPQDAAGVYPITASFTDAAGNYQSASDGSQSFTVTLEDTTLTAATSTLLVPTGHTLVLTSTLTDSTDHLPIAGKPVTMRLGATGPVCTGTTNASGVATCTTGTVPASMQGPFTITYHFAGDAYDAAASTTRPALVFSYLAKGSFDLGNTTVTNAGTTGTVTWWSDSWSSANVLSGGTAPSAFKGFAPNLLNASGTATTNLNCTDSFNYNTTGGNSSSPPLTVPKYMATAVSGKVHKSGNWIKGDIVKVVVVKTNTGYGPSPSMHGTGKVVATICHK